MYNSYDFGILYQIEANHFISPVRFRFVSVREPNHEHPYPYPINPCLTIVYIHNNTIKKTTLKF